MLKMLQLNQMTLEVFIEFIQREELIEKFRKEQNQFKFMDKYMIKKTILNSNIVTEHEPNSEKCPACG